MARKKSVYFSAKPAHEKSEHPADTRASDTSSLRGEFIPAAASIAADAHPVSGDAGFGPVARTVYTAVYLLSFGCVFGTMIVGRLVPGRDVIARGIGDGARAAKDAVSALDERGEKIRAAFQEAVLKA